MAIPTPRQVNTKNHNFWGAQSQLRDKRISNEAVVTCAISLLDGEVQRLLPFGLRKSFEQALAEAEEAKKIIVSKFSSKGGRIGRVDALQSLIQTLVLEIPQITVTQLLGRLEKKKEEGEGIISSIDSEDAMLAGDVAEIHFVDDDETPKTASIAGLKDRLSRAKQKLKSR